MPQQAFIYNSFAVYLIYSNFAAKKQQADILWKKRNSSAPR